MAVIKCFRNNRITSDHMLPESRKAAETEMGVLANALLNI